MLQIKNLSKSYGAKKAVSNLSFVVEDGDIMGFIGKNGAGKTTTLKACLGIIGIDEGEILLSSAMSWGLFRLLISCPCFPQAAPGG